MKITANPTTFEGQRIRVNFGRVQEREDFGKAAQALRVKIAKNDDEREKPITFTFMNRRQADAIRGRLETAKAVVGLAEIEFAGDKGRDAQTVRIVPLPFPAGAAAV